ncbi:glycosyltransferase family 2 protein [Paenibacillus sp. P96]|uniref:Glycosyltransferase family 2 protein n=1 Tax=Paenibacillus zeirhizosphaerae TaxID=2987519 RepID=A0ABT9FY13_9BACL|nr:glycosyltransferase family 2 protein [Paenibacillus sp. P96]MDP4099357.1 glycosyltransferase family 2 protein [Paenibacillus sp. P96]
MTRLRRTVIAHFYNEEYLLPWWLANHTRLFDHGVLINYGSTDRSVEIIRQFAPRWEIRDSRNEYFDSISADREVMDIEQEFDGWKMALNITEFFRCKDIDLFLQQVEQSGHQACAIRSAIMVDPLDIPLPPLSLSHHLFQQRYYGFIELGHTRSRVIHRFPNGYYHIGRHSTAHPHQVNPPGAMLLWYAFSPWTEETKKRKLQIKTRMPPSGSFGGYQHWWGPDELEQQYQGTALHAVDLRKDTEYFNLCF